MKQTIKSLLVIALLMCVNAQYADAKSANFSQRYKPIKANEGRKLMSLKKAMLSDVHLAKSVKYFDIKQYDANGKYVTGWSFDMTAYKRLTAKEKKKIRSARAKKPKGSFWKRSMNDGAYAGFYNLHYLDTNSKVHTVNSRKGLLSFLGTVDTPAEISMLFLGHGSGKIRYKKQGNIYNIRINDVSFSDCDGCGEPACTLFVQQKVMDKRGKLLLNKQVSEKNFNSEKTCSKF